MWRNEAQAVANFIEQQLDEVDAVVTDPRKDLVLASDRWGLETMVEALLRCRRQGPPCRMALSTTFRGGWIGRTLTKKDDGVRWSGLV